MWGRSYGGINSLAVAALQPPHLRAITPVHATDDNWDSLFEHRGSRLMFWADPQRCRWVPRRDLDRVELPSVMRKIIAHGLKEQ